mgnify:FL=1
MLFRSAWTSGGTEPTSKHWNNLTHAINPENNTELYIFFDTMNIYKATGSLYTWSVTPTGFQPYSVDNAVYFAVLDFTGVISRAATVYGIGYSIAANAIRDTQRKTIYLPCTTYSELQSAVYLMDILKGRSTSYYLVDITAGKPSPLTYSHVKCLEGLATFSQQINTCSKPSANVYEFINNGYIVKFNLAPTYAQQSQYFSQTSHLTGGQLWAYDGDSISEHNIFQGPEIVDIYCGQQYLDLELTGSFKEWYITVPCAAAFKAGSTNTYGYINYESLGVARYIWFQVDGNGTNPSPAGRTGTLVSLASADSSFDVASKIVDVASGFSAVYVQSGLTAD